MIKPVKRNKRLKWIDSHYSYQHRIDNYFEIASGYIAANWEGLANWEAPADVILGKSVLEDVYEGLKRVECEGVGDNNGFFEL